MPTTSASRCGAGFDTLGLCPEPLAAADIASPVECLQAFETAILFTLYELAGVVTNLVAGVMGAKWGIRATLLIGLTLQVLGIGMLMGYQVRPPPPPRPARARQSTASPPRDGAGA